MKEISSEEFHLLKDYLFLVCGIDVPEEKAYLFRNRLASLLTDQGYSSFLELYHGLEKDEAGTLKQTLVEVMTTNETAFFRDEHPFTALRDVLLPELAQRRKQEAMLLPPRISIWSVGCSSGQEPYSIAMVLSEWLKQQQVYTKDQIFLLASDISDRILAEARRGRYSKSDLDKGLPDHYRNKYFTEINGVWQINSGVQDMVHFQRLNISQPFAGRVQKFDIIFCRNLIIYFSMELKQEIIRQLRSRLNPGGVLILGASETLFKISDEFESVHAGGSVFYRVRT